MNTEEQQTLMTVHYVLETAHHMASANTLSLMVASTGEQSPFAYVTETFSRTWGLCGEELSAVSREEEHSAHNIGVLEGDLVRLTERRGNGAEEVITREGIYLYHKDTLHAIHERGFALVDYHGCSAANLWENEEEDA